MTDEYVGFTTLNVKIPTRKRLKHLLAQIKKEQNSTPKMDVVINNLLDCYFTVNQGRYHDAQ